MQLSMRPLGQCGKIVMWRKVSDDHVLGEALTSLLNTATA
jgi:hypothetical protein